MEQINIAALGGADNIIVNDLSTTGVTQVEHRSVGHARQRRR